MTVYESDQVTDQPEKSEQSARPTASAHSATVITMEPITSDAAMMPMVARLIAS
jgi:hypothetical protein